MGEIDTSLWVKRKLGDLVSIRTGKLNSNAAKQNGRYPFFTCSRETFWTDTYSFDCECVLLAGNNAAGIYPIKFFKGKFDAYQRTYVIRSKDEHFLNNRFLFYLLQPKLELLKSISTGAATKFLTLNILQDLDLLVPKHDIQCKIAAILSTYDELIKNNNRRIKILEEMVRLIYQEWFVDLRFPGHKKVNIVNSSSGGIPDGWKTIRVGQIVKRIPAGKLYEQKTVFPSGEVPVLDQGRSGIIGYHNDLPSVMASEEDPVIVFANHTCYQRLIQYPFSAIQNVLPFVPNPDQYRNIYWLHWATKDLVEFNDYKGHWPEFMSKTLLLPSGDLCEYFGDIVEPICKLIYKFERININLSETRDFLLPKLISGRIDVSNFDIDMLETAA